MMGGAIKFLGIYAIIPVMMLLTVSFFVLVVARKLEKGVLQSFGNIIAMLLWVVAALVLATAIYTISEGSCHMMGKYGYKGTGYKHHMMQE